MNATGKGIARLRFWGEFSALIAIEFDSDNGAKAAIEKLNHNMDFGDFQNACGGRSKSSGWYLYPQKNNIILVEVGEPALTEVINRLVSYGADKKKILSVAKSIDYGEKFEISIEIEDKAQMKLFE